MQEAAPYLRTLTYVIHIAIHAVSTWPRHLSVPAGIQEVPLRRPQMLLNGVQPETPVCFPSVRKLAV